MLSTRAAHAAPREAVARVTLVSDILWMIPADICHWSWDIDDVVIYIGSVPFLSQLTIHPGSVSVKGFIAWSRLSDLASIDNLCMHLST